MQNSLVLLFSLIFCTLFAQPGKDGTLTISSGSVILNKYCPLSTSITAGSNSLSIANTTFVPLCEGDLIMIYQAQGASINSTNTINYGDITNYNSAGLYEFKYVQSVIGNVITTQSAFTNSYALNGRPQLIKVPQYSTLTVNAGASVVPKEWKDTTIAAVPYRFGGLVVIHAISILNNGTITASGNGFRGGVLFNTIFPTNVTDYVSAVADNGGEKGESISGYQLDYDVLGGRYCRGAAANGGGGGNSVNSPGGGGGNGNNGNTWSGQGVMIVNANNPLTAWALDPSYISNGSSLTNSSGGGRGGYSWAEFDGNALADSPGSVVWGGDSRREVGGLGGHPLTNIDPENRIYLGGGGGSGHQNNSIGGAGARGGGIVYLITTGSLTGTGYLISNGNSGANAAVTPNNWSDGPGGGGAGGSIILKTNSMGSFLNISVNGGKGGDQMPPTPNLTETEGGGGGGGGGFVALSNSAVIPFILGGLNGISNSPGVTEMTSNGATQGATGQTNTVSLNFISFSVTPVLITANSPCSGNSLSLSVSAAANYSWSGPNAFTSGMQNPIVSVNSTTLMSGTYSVTRSMSSTCTLTPTSTVAVIVRQTPTITSTSSTSCGGNTSTLVASGVVAYTWNPTGITGSTFTNNPMSTSVYTIVGLAANNCSASATSTITVPPTLSLTIAANSTSACVGNSVTLTANNSGGIPGYTYTWTNGPLNAANTISQPAGSYVYTVVSTDALSCIASQTIPISFFSNPILVVPSTSICPAFAGTLNVNGALNYTWFPSMSSGSILVANPPATTVYSVNGLSATGCSASATASIVVQPTPSLLFVTATITCANLGSATVTPTGGIGPFSYSWNPTAQTNYIATGLYPGDYTVSVFDNSTNCSVNSFTTFVSLVPFTGTVVASDSLKCNSIPTGTASIALSGGSGSQNYLWTNPQLSTQSNPIANFLSAGIHTVLVSDGITFCNVTHTFSIEQPTPLSLVTTASPPLACVGVSVTLSASNSGGTPGYSYTWTPGPVSATRSVTELSGGTFVYTVQSQDAYSCSVNNTVAVTFVDYPVISASKDTICIGAYATLSVTGANTYSWNPGNGSGANFYPSPLITSNYTVIGNILGCRDTLVTNVVVNPLPIPVISGNTVVCQDQTINLTGSGGVSYNWAGPLFSGITSQNLILNSVALNKSGVYSLTVTSVDGCKASTSVSVTVLSKPIVNISGAAVCIGMPASLSVSGGIAYVWSGPDGFSSTQSSVSIPTVSGSNSGIYTVVVTGANSCPATASVQLTGYPFPLPTPSINLPPMLCQNSSFTLQGSGGTSYVWAGPGGFNSTQQSPGLIATNLGMSGIYTLTVKNASNCIATTSASLTVFPLPKGTLTSSISDACIPFCSNFKLDITSQIYPIASNSFFVNGAVTADTAFNFCFINEGSFIIKSVITDVNGCSTSNSLSVFARPLPRADFSYSPLNPVENIDYVNFTDASTGDQIDAWNWFFTSNSDSSLVKNPQYLYANSGVFPIALTVKNKWGCADTIVKTIEVINDFSFYLPNSFTPNGDGINDIFKPKGVGIVKYNIDIFNRWGEKIFNSEDFYYGWDGSFKGKACKTDVYIWKARVTNPSGKILDYSGHVSILEN